MKRSIGDILPDQTDNCRFDTMKHKEGYYRRIIEGCTMCNGSLTVGKGKEKRDCDCNKSLKLVIELLKSNFPQNQLSMMRDRFFSRQAVEVNIYKTVKDEDGGKLKVSVGRPIDFREGFLRSFVKHKNFMISNSCSFMMTGNNESGKTYAALWVLYRYVESGISGHYLRFKNYLNLLNSSYNNPDDRKLLNQIRNVKVLVIDELGKEHGKAEYATTELEELIKYRQDNLSCTILITNLDYSDFVDTYGNHVKSAFNKNFKVFVMNPDANFRKKTRVAWPKNS